MNQKAKERVRERRARWTPEERERAYKQSRDLVKSQNSRPETWGMAAIRAARSRAKKKNIPFNITRDDIHVPDVCPITLKPFQFGGALNAGNNPSIDRVIPELGYVKGNVRVISRRANTMKNDCTDPAAFERLALYLREATNRT